MSSDRGVAANKFKDILVRILLILGSLFYLVAIVYVGVLSLQSPNEVPVLDEQGKQVLDQDGNPLTVTAEPAAIPSLLSAFITGVGAALAVHTGALLGIDVGERKGKETGAVPQWWQSFINSRIWQSLGRLIRDAFSAFSMENVPMIATAVYLIGLTLAVIFIALEGFSPASAELLQASAVSFIAVFVGIFSVRTA
jgi:hypothetical protein